MEIFRKLTTIPRDSGDEKRIAEYLISFAKERSFEAITDDARNVIIRKHGRFENSPTLVLQNHTYVVFR